MRSEWKEVRLGDVVLFNPKESLPKGTRAKKIAMERLQPFTKIVTDYETEVYSGGSKFRNDDTIMARITPCLENGKTAQVNVFDTNEVGFGSTEFIVLRNVEDVTDKDYIYYLAINPDFREVAIKSMVGSSGRQRVQQGVLEEYTISLPPLPQQRAIAATLSCLDDKIEQNNKINANLEAQAQAIFKSWFVDFEPFQDGEFVDSELGIIPRGWRVGRLSELISVRYGKDHKKLTDGNIPVYGSGGVMRRAERAVYDKESVLIPRKGTLNNIIYINTPFWTVDTMFYSEMLIPHVAKFVYFFLDGKDLASMNAGSAVPSMTIDILNNIPVVIAPDEIYQRYDLIVNPMFEALQNNNEQSSTLAALRDTLLPQLISREIDVPRGGS